MYGAASGHFEQAPARKPKGPSRPPPSSVLPLSLSTGSNRRMRILVLLAHSKGGQDGEARRRSAPSGRLPARQARRALLRKSRLTAKKTLCYTRPVAAGG
jgi:hypothetical protein